MGAGRLRLKCTPHAAPLPPHTCMHTHTSTPTFSSMVYPASWITSSRSSSGGGMSDMRLAVATKVTCGKGVGQGQGERGCMVACRAGSEMRGEGWGGEMGGDECAEHTGCQGLGEMERRVLDRLQRQRAPSMR